MSDPTEMSDTMKELVGLALLGKEFERRQKEITDAIVDYYESDAPDREGPDDPTGNQTKEGRQ